ncbi:peptidase M23, partial [Geomonas sp.]|uniref:murein hydrolase activator EnvC family protein n=1 Tax=Geomonas sp. TaxID=2651584 RepID=UPI002B49F4E8
MRVTRIIACLTMLLLLPTLSLAGVKEDLQGVKKQIKEKNALLTKTKKVETQVSGELQQIQKSLSEKQASLNSLGRELASVGQSVDKTMQDIERERQEAEKKRQQINRRVAALYKAGDTGNLRVFFSSESLPQMSENLRYMRGVLENDKKLFAQYNQNMDRLKDLKGRLEQEAARKEGIRRSMEAKKLEIEQEKSRKANYLAKVRQDKQSYQASIKELQANASRLQAMFAKLEARNRKAALEARKALEARNRKAYSSKPGGKGSAQASLPPSPQVPDYGLGSQKGRLSLPVKGTIV